MIITCGCGHQGPAETFIETSKDPFTQAKKDLSWWLCPACRARMRGPKTLLEIGVQVIEADGQRKEILPTNPSQVSFRKWLRGRKVEEMRERLGQLDLIGHAE